MKKLIKLSVLSFLMFLGFNSNAQVFNVLTNSGSNATNVNVSGNYTLMTISTSLLPTIPPNTKTTTIFAGIYPTLQTGGSVFTMQPGKKYWVIDLSGNNVPVSIANIGGGSNLTETSCVCPANGNKCTMTTDVVIKPDGTGSTTTMTCSGCSTCCNTVVTTSPDTNFSYNSSIIFVEAISINYNGVTYN